MKSLTVPILLALSLGTCYGDAKRAAFSKGPYLQNPTTAGITVCWVTDDECRGKVRVKPETGKGKAVTVAEKTPTRYHKVHVAKLKPYTRYTYTVACLDVSADGAFRTAAGVSQPFRFAAYGDCRTQPLVHSSVLKRMIEFQPDFVVQSGDLVANGENESQWDEFWEVVRPLVCNTAYYPALGNHEKAGAPYYRYFDVKREYSFDYGNVHFIALDSNRKEDEFAEQESWLREDLTAHQKADWRIVFFHHTPYTCVTKEGRRDLAALLRARLEPIFQAGNVQLVINGHDHDYQHHLAKGIHYVVTGGGGAPLYDVLMDTPNVVKAIKEHHYCEVRVDHDTLSLRAVKPDGDVIDEFELHRTTDR